VSISEGHVCRLVAQCADASLRSAGNEIAQQIELGVEAEQPAEPDQQIEIDAAVDGDGPADDAPVVLSERSRGNRMGAALCYPALEALGLLQAAGRCFRLPDSELFGVRAVTLTLFFMALLQTTTVEAARFLRRWDFGALIGTTPAPVVRTLRRKLANLAGQGQALEFGRQLAQRWVEQAMIATAYLYIDGHMKVYTGRRRLKEIWNSQRRMPLPGFVTYFVADSA